ncbi:hypothetical protein BH10PSE10_BH10PSE10_01090 [soil metagenome]
MTGFAKSWPGKFAAGVFFAAVGAAFAVCVAGTRVINPFDVSWLGGDSATGYLGWAFFRQEDHLSFPLGWTSRLGYPLGEPIAYLDSLPLVATILWPFRHVLPPDFQYIGLWFVLCVVLQFYFGYRISKRLTGGQQLPAILGGLLFMTAPAFVWRSIGHFPLASHWLILAAFDFYLSAARNISRPQMAAGALLCFVAGGVNPYITAMVLLVLLAAYLRWLTAADADVQQDWPARVLFAAMGAALSLGLAVFALVIFGFLRPGEAGGYAGAGYKVYSMNLLAPINPWEYPGLLWGELPTSRDQYEGYNYLGLGIICLGLAALVRRPSILKNLFGRRAIAGWLIFAVSLLLALSLKATAGNFVLYDISVPDPVLNVLGAFRASGRLFWPAFYLILCCAVGASFAAFGTGARVALLLALFVQIFDLRPLYAGLRENWARASSATFTADAVWQEAGRKHRHLIVIPAWQCSKDNADTPGGFPGYWIFGKLAAGHGMTINSFYAGRTSPKQLEYSCKQQPADIQRSGFEPDTAYVFNAIEPVLSIPIRGHFCRPLNGVVLCSVVRGQRGIASGAAQTGR